MWGKRLSVTRYGGFGGGNLGMEGTVVENRMGPDWGNPFLPYRGISLYCVVSGKMTEVFDSRWKIGY